MAISVNFNGASILKPGAYTKTTVQRAGGGLAVSGIVAIFGEADGGMPGSSDDIRENVYTGEQMAAIVAKYKSGPIVDACKLLFAPSNDTRIANGASQVYIYKTNASTRATLDIPKGSDTYGTLTTKDYGIAANDISVTIEIASSKATITLERTTTGEKSVSDPIGGQGLTLTPVGSPLTALATVDATTLTLKHTAVDSAAAKTFTLANYSTIGKLIVDIAAVFGSNFTISVSGLLKQKSPAILDKVTNQNLNSKALLATDAYDVQQWFAAQDLVTFTPNATHGIAGLPTALSIKYFSAGSAAVKGATSAASITAALTALKKVRANFVVPLFSRDAASDITDGLTDAASDYAIDTINAAVVEHCKTMSGTKARSERQAILSYRGTFTNAKAKAADLANERVSLAFQDVKVVDAAGLLGWKHPWAFAALAAGLQCGAPLGEPITFKYLAVSGVKQAASDFDPATDYDAAISNNLLFAEPVISGGFRVVVGNTTYGKDDSFVWNRISVIYAADVVQYDLRNRLEAQFAGVRSAVASPSSVKNYIITKMGDYKNMGLIVGDDTNEQLGWKNLTVTLSGNTMRYGITITPEQGVDFILGDVVLDTIQASA